MQPCHTPGTTAARGLLAPETRGLVRVLGGPGTGKSSLLVDAAIARIRAGADPESILLLSGSGRMGMQARNALTTALLWARQRGFGRGRRPRAVGPDRAQLRVRSIAAGRPERGRRTSAAGHQRREQDAIIRDLLVGDLEDGPRAAVAWPAHLRPALTTAGIRHRTAKPVGPLRRTRRRSAGARAAGSAQPPSGMGRRRSIRAPVRAGHVAAGGGRDGRATGDDPGARRRRARRRRARGLRGRSRAARGRTRPGAHPAGRRRPAARPAGGPPGPGARGGRRSRVDRR